MTPTPQIQAWVYPGPPSCSASTELADGRTIDTLKPQYFTLSDSGALTQITSGCNSYSIENAALISAHSRQQFVTISGSIAGIGRLANSHALATTFALTLTAFLHATHFTGVELDIEDYSSWTPAQYASYKNVVMVLGGALHAGGYQLMIDGPAIINTTYQGYYPWKYEDFNSLPVDYLVSMCYDLQYDSGAGTPVASFADITGCCNWMLSKVSDHGRIIIGLNSYGYMGKTGAYASTAQTYEQASRLPGFASAVRDPASGEMMWAQNGISYNYSDSTTLDKKLQTVLATGITQVSIWHLGGNAWFSQAASVSPTPEIATPPDSALTTFRTAYPGFDQWYAGHFDAQGNYIG